MEADEDLKILARIRSKERMQATRKRRKEEQVKKPGNTYNSPHILDKAVAKGKCNLPASPTKAVEFYPIRVNPSCHLKQDVSDVYNDSDSDSDNESINEESPPPSHQTSKSPAEACRKTDGTVCAAILPKDICAGLYVVVQLLCKSGKKKDYSISLCGVCVRATWMKMGRLECNF
ncbi:hypothetical protein TNCT_537631 [Trichonephila clavata]|uniref:Uncharacterized protein n=1 Tax=Trichonephila clavata TaxID=2740835 RepID=A0A8X6FUU2_TRICU|nr:hypothetical protein TNCT_537631 [Trichonephila clavata]